MTNLTEARKRMIRKHFGHGKGSRRVRIRKDGIVEYTGTTKPHDFDAHRTWLFGGYVEDILKQVEEGV